MSTTCLFCEIAAGVVPAHRVYEDDLFVGFLDNRPLFHGHTLLVPRVHHETLLDLPRELHGPFLTATQAVSRAVRDATASRGFFNAMNNVVSQSVPHLHMHVAPRNPKDGLRGFFWPRTTYASDEEAAAVAASIRKALTAAR